SKGFDVLMHALALVVQDHPQLECIIIGDGPERSSLRKLAVELQLQRFVTFTGLLERDAIREHVGSASIFVLASCEEGLPLALLEAMAAGLPIIATNVGGIPSVVDHGQQGLLVEPNDSQSLAEAIHVLMDSRELNKALRVNAAQRASDYSLS